MNKLSFTFATMRHILFLVVFLSLGYASYAQKNVYFNKLVEKNGVYTLNGQPFSGISLERHDSTKKKMIELQWKDGLLHGVKSTWFPNEAIRQVMHFDMGRRHGMYTTYYLKGTIKEQGNYHYDTLHGTVEGFYENGKPKFKFNYNKGIKDGVNQLFFDNGKIEQSVNFVNTRIHGVFKSWYPAGHLMKEIGYHMGILDGSYKTWHMDGSVAEEGFYKMGKKHGVFKVYEIFMKEPMVIESYENGKKNGTWLTLNLEGDTALMCSYKKDVLHGSYVSYHKGKVEDKGNYVNGEKDGYWIQQFSSLVGAQEGMYKLGVRVGPWKLYDIEGKELATLTFNDDGEIIEEKWYKKKKIIRQP